MNTYDILQIARELPEAERVAYLEEACRDAEQCEHLERMLADDWFRGLGEDGDTVAIAEVPGTLIGAYTLLEKIGEGAFGVVFMAEQRGELTRRVALKIIKKGMDTREVITRFEAERQALAMMDHPGIAKVFDAGATETGRPYFVMELVRGVPITQFCDEKNYTIRQRLALFMEVCDAVTHAHQKGIIHRDLKPSNILVGLDGEQPVPKVIDFGIAKATQQPLTEKTLFTRFDQFVGTFPYIAPEQSDLSAIDVDTRADIYALGMLLYELLVGKLPFDPKSARHAGLGEMRRIIREDEPASPSTCATTLRDEERRNVETTRGTDLGGLGGLIRGDLDWIVLKAMDKDRTRRYETVNGLRRDLQHFLADEPVAAAAPSTLYRFRKFARRHRGRIASAAAAMLVLLAGATISVQHAIRGKQTLGSLRATAPAFLSQARDLIEQGRFEDALVEINLAVRLRPNEPLFLLARADLLRCQLRLEEARAAYQKVLRYDPAHPRAAAGASLCEELLASQRANGGEFSLEMLASLLLAMKAEQRPAAEIRPLAKRMDEGGERLRNDWLQRLRDLPIGEGKPLEKRLTFGETGRLQLVLSGTAVSDLGLLQGMPLDFLNLAGCASLHDLEPLRGMPLRTLHLCQTSVTDITPLGTLEQLSILHLCKTPVRDISPLREMPLEDLFLGNTLVEQLEPLAGAPLRHLDVSSVPATDFDVLTGMPLETLNVQHNSIRDLSLLRGMPLRELCLWGCDEARNYDVLSSIDTLESLILPKECSSLPEEEQQALDDLERHPRLNRIVSRLERNDMRVNDVGPKEVFFRQWNAERAVPKALHSLRDRLDAADLEYWIHERPSCNIGLTITTPSFRDLTLLEGAPIGALILDGTSVTNLEPLREMPLRKMPLEVLSIADTQIDSIAPLLGTGIVDLRLNKHLRDVEKLREIETLAKVSVPEDAPYVEQLQEVSSPFRLRKFRRSAPDESIDLCKLCTPRDRVEGEWESRDGSLVGKSDMSYKLDTRVEPQGAYKLEITLVRIGGNDSLNLLLPVGEYNCHLVLGGWPDSDGVRSGLDQLDGIGGSENSTSTSRFRWEEGQMYGIVVEVNLSAVCDTARIVVRVDGENEPLIDWSGCPSRLSHNWDHVDPSRIGIGGFDSTLEFRQIQFTPLPNSGGAYLWGPDPEDK